MPGDAGTPLVSCLCVTRGRPALLARALRCYRAQTWARCELLVVFEGDDEATRAVLVALPDAGIDAAAIRVIEVPAEPKRSLGALRNMAVAAAHGEYVAQWDDDDWHAPQRLAAQIGALQRAGAAACVLSRWLFWDAQTGDAFVSGRRAWEGSLVARRDAMPAYPDVTRGEDTEVVRALAEQGRLAMLDEPTLYIYTVHAGNTWGRAHWETHLRPYAERLPADWQARVRLTLEEPA